MILNGWKEIANHLGRGVRTVQRWEQFGLPVRRPKGTDRSAVLALSEELDAWVKRCATHVNGAPDFHEGMDRLTFKVQRIQELMQQVRAERQELSERTRQLRSGMQELRQRFGHSAQRVHVMAAAAAQAEAQNPPPRVTNP